MKNIVFILSFFVLFNCSLFDEGTEDTLPKGWNMVEGLKGGLVSSFYVDGNRIYAGKQAYGISYSDDYGASWIEMNNGLDEINSDGIKSLETKTINAFVKFDGNLLVGIKAIDETGGIYTFNNDSEQWEHNGFNDLRINDMKVIDNKMIVGTDDGIYILEEQDGLWLGNNIGNDGFRAYSIAIIENSIYIALGLGFYKTTDLGANWVDLLNGSLSDRHIKCVYAERNVLFVGTDDGIYRSEDYGESWITENTGIPHDSFTGFANISKITSKNNVLIATYDLSTFLEQYDDFTTPISRGIIYSDINDLNWTPVEFYGKGDKDIYNDLYSIGAIDNKVFVGLITPDYYGSHSNEVWVNSTILNRTN